jgi:hypothetical protein
VVYFYMKKTAQYLTVATLLALGATFAASVTAQVAAPNLLATLDGGLWQFRKVGGGASGAAVERLCVKDRRKLAQIQHSRFNCEQTILKSSAVTALISYSCAGQGQGLTSIRKEGSDLIHIDSQGIAGGAPFAFTVEARRVGDCPA